MPYIDDLNLKPGTTSYLDLPVAQTALGDFNLPLIAIQGSQPGPTLAITAGVHGCEYTGIVASIWLARELDPARLSGRVLIVPVVNVRAFEMRMAFLNPLDYLNVNRVFPGRRYGALTEELAYVLQNEIITQSDAYLDLHGGDLWELGPLHVSCQRVGVKEVDEKSELLARHFNVELLNFMGDGIDELTETHEDQGLFFAGIKNGWTAVGNAALAGVPAVLMEAGGGGTLDRTLVEVEMKGIRNLMRYMGMLEGQPVITVNHRLCYGMYPMKTKNGGLFFPNFGPGDYVHKGDHLGEMQNLRGEVIGRYTSPINGVVIMVYSTPVRMSGETIISLARVDD
jgi:predicted deacylase